MTTTRSHLGVLRKSREAAAEEHRIFTEKRERHAEATAEGKRRAAELAKRKRRHRMRLAKASLADGYSLEKK